MNTIKILVFHVNFKKYQGSFIDIKQVNDMLVLLYWIQKFIWCFFPWRCLFSVFLSHDLHEDCFPADSCRCLSFSTYSSKCHHPSLSDWNQGSASSIRIAFRIVVCWSRDWSSIKRFFCQQDMAYGFLIEIGVNLTVEEFAPDVEAVIGRSKDAG